LWPAVASNLLSGEKAMSLIHPSWLQSIFFPTPKTAPHSLTVLSARDADVNSLPSGENVMTLTQPLWPSSLIFRLASIIDSLHPIA
jgi:hypothetical protein